jgi:hypothetical protein
MTRRTRGTFSVKRAGGTLNVTDCPEDRSYEVTIRKNGTVESTHSIKIFHDDGARLARYFRGEPHTWHVDDTDGGEDQ